MIHCPDHLTNLPLSEASHRANFLYHEALSIKYGNLEATESAKASNDLLLALHTPTETESN